MPGFMPGIHVFPLPFPPPLAGEGGVGEWMAGTIPAMT